MTSTSSAGGGRDLLVEFGLVEQRYQAVLEVLGGASVTEVAERFGVTRQSVHRWLRRYAARGFAGLVDGSTAPGSCPHQMAAEVEARIVALRREHPGWGPRTIGHQLGREGIASLPGRSSIYRCLVRHRLVEVQPRLFYRICRENGIRHLLTAPRAPTTTGKVERFHKTLRREFLDDKVFVDLDLSLPRSSGQGWCVRDDDGRGRVWGATPAINVVQIATQRLGCLGHAAISALTRSNSTGARFPIEV